MNRTYCRLADTADAAVLPDLPEEIALAMSDIAGAAHEGLLAMCVAAGLAVMADGLKPRSPKPCGPKGKHDANRAAVRHGMEKGSVTLGGRRVSVTPAAGAHGGRARGAGCQLRALRLRRHAHPGGDGADAGRGGHPPARPHQRASQGAQVDKEGRNRPAARRFRAGSSSRPRPRWPS